MNGKWEYMGEGGKHALFASKDFPGKLLRIKKEDVRHASSGPFDGYADDLLEGPVRSLRYFQRCIYPYLEHYVDIPELVPLDWEFLVRLRERTIAEYVIPQARANDWIPLTVNEPTKHKKRRRPTGMLLVDYRVALPRMVKSPAGILGRRLQIEIKPKAGYLSSSPLVDPNHRVKLKSSRFSLLQLLHQQGHVDKGWTKSAHGVKKSDFDPLDLFSHDALRMTRAIRSLLASPQNNLKLWYNNQNVTRDATILTKNMDTILKDMGIIRSAVSLDDSVIETLFGTFLANLVVPILNLENILEKLLTLQKLDILDVDGAILVAEHLLHLCHGSKPQAEEHIANPCYQRTSDDVHPLLFGSPFNLCSSRNESRVWTLCEIVEDFRHAISESAPELPPSNVLDVYHNQAKDHVSKLSINDCSYLLANWLLSLAMCDVSILFMIEQLPSDSFSEYSEESMIDSTDTPSSEGGGVLRCCLAEGATLSFAYMVRIIDFDQKPPKKLWDKKETEGAFANLQ